MRFFSAVYWDCYFFFLSDTFPVFIDTLHILSESLTTREDREEVPWMAVSTSRSVLSGGSLSILHSLPVTLVHPECPFAFIRRDTEPIPNVSPLPPISPIFGTKRLLCRRFFSIIIERVIISAWGSWFERKFLIICCLCCCELSSLTQIGH